MPIYQYVCKGCGIKGDYILASADLDPEICVNCGHRDLERYLPGQTFSTRTGSRSKERSLKPNEIDLNPEKFTFHFEKIGEIYRVISPGHPDKKGKDN